MDEEGGRTYGCVVDEVGGFGVGVWGVRVVIVVVVVIAMIGVLWWSEFGGWDLDREGGEGFAQMGEGGDCSDVGLES